MCFCCVCVQDEKVNRARVLRERRLCFVASELKESIELKQFHADELRIQKTDDLLERLRKEVRVHTPPPHVYMHGNHISVCLSCVHMYA